MLLRALVRVALLNRFEERPRLAPPWSARSGVTRTRRSSSQEHGRTARRDSGAILYRRLARRLRRASGHPSQPALRRPSSMCAWSSVRIHGTRLRTYMSNEAGATAIA